MEDLHLAWDDCSYMCLGIRMLSEFIYYAKTEATYTTYEAKQTSSVTKSCLVNFCPEKIRHCDDSSATDIQTNYSNFNFNAITEDDDSERRLCPDGRQAIRPSSRHTKYFPPATWGCKATKWVLTKNNHKIGLQLHFCCWNYLKDMFSTSRAESNFPTLTYGRQKTDQTLVWNTILHINLHPFSGNTFVTSFFRGWGGGGGYAIG